MTRLNKPWAGRKKQVEDAQAFPLTGRSAPRKGLCIMMKQVDAVEKAATAVIPGALSVPGFTITATSLQIDDSVTPEQAKQYLATACAIGTAAQWWVGDLLNAMEKRKW